MFFTASAGLWRALAAGLLPIVFLNTKREPCYKPVNLVSRADFESRFRGEAPQTIQNSSGIALRGEQMFVGEKNAGIHVIDNADPTDPRPVAYLAVPGMTQFSLTETHIYAASSYGYMAVFAFGDDASLAPRIVSLLPGMVRDYQGRIAGRSSCDDSVPDGKIALDWEAKNENPLSGWPIFVVTGILVALLLLFLTIICLIYLAKILSQWIASRKDDDKEK